MPTFHPRIRAAAVGVAAFALLGLAVGGTFAASNPATLYACYDVYGNVRVSDVATCKLPGGGRLVNWSTAGAPGPVGTTGATGPTGPTGATGPSVAGTASTAVLEYTYPVGALASVPFVGFTAGLCPSGTVVTGGGVELAATVPADRAKFALVSSRPFGPAPPAPATGWYAAYTISAAPTGLITFDVYAVCAP